MYYLFGSGSGHAVRSVQWQAASCGWRRSIGRLPDGRVYLPLTPLTRNLPANYLRPSVDAILASVSPNCVARIVALSRQVASRLSKSSSKRQYSP
jgi:hypothetical protein